MIKGRDYVSKRENTGFASLADVRGRVGVPTIRAFKKRRHVPMIRLAYLLVVLVLCALLVLAAEGAARLVGLGRPLLYEESALYGYAPRANQREVRRRGAVVTIGSFGLRGTRDWQEPAERRILFMGDSVTYGGSYIDDRQTFAEQACEQLNARSATDSLCANGGVNAYGTDNMRARLQHLPFTNHDAVIVTVVPGDATRGMARLRALPYFSRAPAAPLRGLTEALAFVLDRIRSRLRFQRDTTADGQAANLTAARLSLAQLLAELRGIAAAGRLVAVVYTPPRRELEGQQDALGQLVRQALAASGLPYLDMRAVLEGEDLDAVFYDAVHLDVYGHALYGRAIGEWLLPRLTAGPAS